MNFQYVYLNKNEEEKKIYDDEEEIEFSSCIKRSPNFSIPKIE